MASANEFLTIPAVANLAQLTDYDEIREVLRSPLFNQGAYEFSSTDFMHDCMTMLDGARHFQRRRFVGQLFSEQAMSEYRREHLFPVIDATLAEISNDRNSDGVVEADLVSLVWKMLYRMAGAITGIDGLDTPEATDRFITQIRGIGAALVVDWSKENRAELLEAGRIARRAFAAEFFEPSYERRRRLVEAVQRSEMSQDSLPKDLVTMLILNRDESWDEELPMRECSVFLVAGTQTTAQAFIPFILQLEDWLVEHQEDRALIYSDPSFIRGAAFESLRLFVAAPARIRKATADVELASGRVIREGERVALWFIPANMQKEHFGEDADLYNPHRHVEGSAQWGLAFGGGAHACIGRPLVTGIGSRAETDGTMVSIARRLYEAGLELDPVTGPQRDAASHYAQYTSVPVRFTRL